MRRNAFFEFTVVLTATESPSIKIASRGVWEQWDIEFFWACSHLCVCWKRKLCFCFVSLLTLFLLLIHFNPFLYYFLFLYSLTLSSLLLLAHPALPCLVQEAEQEEVKAVAEVQAPRSAKKNKPPTSTPQTGSAKKEKKGKHKGQLSSLLTIRPSMCTEI